MPTCITTSHIGCDITNLKSIWNQVWRVQQLHKICALTRRSYVEVKLQAHLYLNSLHLKANKARHVLPFDHDKNYSQVWRVQIHQHCVAHCPCSTDIHVRSCHASWLRNLCQAPWYMVWVGGILRGPRGHQSCVSTFYFVLNSTLSN